MYPVVKWSRATIVTFLSTSENTFLEDGWHHHPSWDFLRKQQIQNREVQKSRALAFHDKDIYLWCPNTRLASGAWTLVHAESQEASVLWRRRDGDRRWLDAYNNNLEYNRSPAPGWSSISKSCFVYRFLQYNHHLESSLALGRFRRTSAADHGD